jgi:hypothetical protein
MTVSVSKRIYVLFALIALSFAATACADATAPDASNKPVIQRDGSNPTPCDNTGSTVKC